MQRFERREEKWVFPFVEYSSEKKQGKYSLIVQLHGAGERGNGKEDLERVDVHGFSALLKNIERENLLVVMPQCPENTLRQRLCG